MEQPQLYAKNNQSSTDVIKYILNQYLKLVKWNTSGGNILDIGCGPGDVTVEVLKPKLPLNSKLVGGDISHAMLKYAEEQYKDTGVNFMFMDIGSITVASELVEKFDNIFSFYCLQWLQNHRQVFTNIYTMLKPGGYIFISYIKSSPIFDTIEQLATTKKWSKYLQGVERFKSIYHGCTNFEKTVNNMLVEIGFNVYVCEVVEHNYIHPSTTAYKDFAKSINPFMGTIPEELHEEHLDDMVKLQHTELNRDGEVVVNYPTKNLVVVASKH